MNGDRLKQARELLGLSQAELAAMVGVTQSTVAYIENGRFLPSTALAKSIAGSLGFPESFFDQPTADTFGLGSLLFRSRTSQAAASDKTRAFRFAELANDLYDRLMAKYRPLPVRIPQVNDNPFDAAKLTRAVLGLSPEKPIGNLVNTLERAGVLVVMLNQAFAGIDAFSVWAGANADRPLIALSPGLPPDKLRLTVAHELGHLVLHRTIQGDLKVVEKEAMKFAGELLFPEEAFQEEVSVPVTLTGLAALKPRWGMSIAAMVMRAYDLDLITERQKTYLNTQIRARKWSPTEPGSDLIPLEKPRAIRQLAEMTYGSSLNYWRIANDLHLPVSIVDSIMDSCIPGNNASSPETQIPTGKVVSLRQQATE